MDELLVLCSVIKFCHKADYFPFKLSFIPVKFIFANLITFSLFAENESYRPIQSKLNYSNLD